MRKPPPPRAIGRHPGNMHSVLSDARSMTVALADTRWAGHHPMYFRELIASLHRLGVHVIALCPEPGDLTPDARLTTGRLVAPNRSLVTGRLDNDPAATALRWWRTRRALEAAEERCGRRADLVFLPYLDSYLRFLPLPGAPRVLLGRPWGGLYFRNQHLGWPTSGLRLRLKRLMKGDRILRSPLALPFVGVLDERFNVELKRFTDRVALQFPDITDETLPATITPIAKALKAKAQGRPIVGLAGTIDRRKGLLTFLRIAELSLGRESWFFAVVGLFHAQSFSARELEWIEDVRRRLGGSLYLDLASERLSDSAYNQVFDAFDIVWVAYEGFQGSSNTLTKAALFAKPVLASEGECIAARVEEFGLGVTFPARNVTAGSAAITQLLSENSELENPRRFEHYRHFHSRHQLDATLRRFLEGSRTLL